MSLFRSANAAVRFAVNYGNDGHIERSAMNKLAEPPKGVDSGLHGLDGAGQAGMIMSIIKRTGELSKNCLIARTVVHKIPCACGAPCCSKFKPNWDWYEAINYLNIEIKRSMDEERKPGVRGIKDDPAMRRALVAKYFGERVRINELAKACDVTDTTVATHHAKVMKLLKKAEGDAWNKVDEFLREAKII